LRIARRFRRLGQPLQNGSAMTARSILLPVASLTAAAALAGLAAPAHAQVADPAAPPLRNTSLFPSMGPDGSGSQFGAQFGLIDPEGEGTPIKRFDIHAAAMSPSGIGGYLTIAGSHVEETTEIGSLEVGGLWAKRGPTTDLALRAGLVLPTSFGSDDEDGFGSGFTHLISTALARPSDLLTAAPDATTLRVAVSPMTRSGNFVARADAGIDIVLDSGNDGENPDPFLHLDLGAGFDNGKGAFLAEFSTLMPTEETDEMIHLLALTGAFHATEQASFYATISRPFGDVFLDDDLDVTNVFFGVRGRP
jgi:hypothetical protein